MMPMNTKKKKPSKKKRVLAELFERCLQSGTMDFSNDDIKDVSKKINFKNPFDAVKIDHRSLLPEVMREHNYVVAHLGEGLHQFIKGIDLWYHDFEQPFTESECRDWTYRPSILNHVNTSESNIISVGFNQRITHDFLYEDITVSPRSYGSHRTKLDMFYSVGDSALLECQQLQMEIDATYEYQGIVTILEGKNHFHKDFVVYQIFHPYLYYKSKQKDHERIKGVNCCYLLRDDTGDLPCIRFYLYEFDDEKQMGSIRLVKKAEYRLIER